jgi:hypothetical protein
MTVRYPLTTTFHLRIVVTILQEEKENYSELKPAKTTESAFNQISHID